MGTGISHYTGGKVKAYRVLKKRLNTGALILFDGNGNYSRLIQCVTHRPWSHIGMVVKITSKEQKNLLSSIDPDDLYLWHSTYPAQGDIIDSITNNFKEGVQLNPLGDFLKNYEGRFAVRNLKPDRETNVDDILWLLKEAEKGYERNIDELLSASCHCLSSKNNLQYYFCSELVAETYTRMGLLQRIHPSNYYAPHSFSSKDGIALKNGFYLEKEVEIRMK